MKKFSDILLSACPTFIALNELVHLIFYFFVICFFYSLLFIVSLENAPLSLDFPKDFLTNKKVNLSQFVIACQHPLILLQVLSLATIIWVYLPMSHLEMEIRISLSMFKDCS